MSDLLTNVAAMTALKALQATGRNLETTQSRISTGLEVREAKDNAAYWSIATTMRTDTSALSTVQDALGLGAAKMDIAYTGMTSALEIVDEIKSKLVASKQPGVDKAKIQAEIKELQAQLSSAASSASFSGENWLSADSSDGNYSAVKKIVSSFTRAADGSVSISTIDLDVTSIELYDSADQSGILDREITTTGTGAVTVSVNTLDISAPGLDTADIDDMIRTVDEAHQKMTAAASTLGASKKRIDMQSGFVETMLSAIDRGIGQLVDADMNEESTRLQSLQVQQQLGVQALQIANSNAQTILSLFQGR